MLLILDLETLSSSSNIQYVERELLNGTACYATHDEHLAFEKSRKNDL